jgi:hypothetical protein
MKTEEMKNFLNLMSEEIEKEKIELFKSIIDSSDMKKFDDPDEFHYAIIYQFEQFIGGYVRHELIDNSDVEFIYKNWGFLDRHFCELFAKYEGSAFSSDKSRTVIKRLLKFYEAIERIKFDYDAEYTFHLPKKIFKTHDQIVNFYKGLKSLFWGRPEKYLQVLINLKEEFIMSNENCERVSVVSAIEMQIDRTVALRVDMEIAMRDMEAVVFDHKDLPKDDGKISEKQETTLPYLVDRFRAHNSNFEQLLKRVIELKEELKSS